jgi:endoglucanase
MNTFEVLKKLSEAPGVAGNESGVSQIVAEEFKKYVDELRTDALGNVIGFKKGTGPSPRRIMLAAHMDEIGLMVSEIEKGFIRFTTVGGIDDRILLGQEVIVHGLKASARNNRFQTAPPPFPGRA